MFFSTNNPPSLNSGFSAVFTSCGDGCARAYDVKSGSMQGCFKGHESCVNCFQVPEKRSFIFPCLSQQIALHITPCFITNRALSPLIYSKEKNIFCVKMRLVCKSFTLEIRHWSAFFLVRFNFVQTPSIDMERPIKIYGVPSEIWSSVLREEISMALPK